MLARPESARTLPFTPMLGQTRQAPRSSPPVTVNVLPEGRNRQGTPSIDPTSHLTVPGWPEERLRALVPALIPFVEKNLHTYDEIWAVHIALGELGVSWPGPGIDSKFRQRVSALLLEACRNGDMEAARSAWAKAAIGESRE